MPWPLSQDYNEAIQNPATSFADPDLRRGEVVVNALGLPAPYSGNFADVYQVRCPDGGSWAVKCFTREALGLRERYQEISRHLRQAKLPFTVDFSYLDQGIRVAGKWYPVLKMQWVEGLTLNQFVGRHLDRPAMLEALSQIWGRMAKHLRAAQIGHCDLQHGNVLLVPGANPNALGLRLIDYDGMWVPALRGKKSGEVGHPCYQHPHRLRDATYDLEVDRFPALLIATSLHALKARGAALWEKYDNGDNLLFKEGDLREPLKSHLFLDLTKTPDQAVQPLVDHLIRALRGGLETAPLLEEVVPLSRSPSTPPPRPSRLVMPAAPVTASPAMAQPVARPSVAVPESVLDFGGSGRSKYRRRRQSGGLLWAAAAVVVLITGGAAAVWMLRSPPKPADTPAPSVPVVQAVNPAPPHDDGVNPDQGEDKGNENRATPVLPSVDSSLSDKPPDAGPDNGNPDGPMKIEPPPPPPGVAVVRELRRFVGHGDTVYFLQFAPDGTRLVSASNGDKEDVDKTTGKLLGQTVGRDDSVRVWDVNTGDQVHKLLFTEGRGCGPRGLCLSPDGRFVAATAGWYQFGPSEPMIYVWDVTTGVRSDFTRPPGDSNLRQAAFAPGGRTLDVLRKDGWLRSYSVPGLTTTNTVKLENDNADVASGKIHAVPYATGFTPDGRCVLGPVYLRPDGYESGDLRLWDRETGKVVRDFPGNGGHVTSVAMSADGSRVLCCTRKQTEGVVRLLDAQTGRDAVPLAGLSRDVFCAAFCPDGERFLTGTTNGTVHLYDAASGKELAAFAGHTGRVSALAVSPDGRRAATAATDGTIRLWPLDDVGAAATAAPPSSKPSRLAAPDPAMHATALEKIRGVYKNEFDSKKAGEVEALANKLLKDGLENADDATNRYALLLAARDQAARAGDTALAFRAADELAARFVVDAAELRVQALELASRDALTPAARAAVAPLALALSEGAVEDDDFVTADRLARAAEAGAAALGKINKAEEAAIQRQAAAVEGLRVAWESVKDAARLLETKPDDPDANLAVGKFYCLQKEDWERGLPLLASGGDSQWKELAQKDLAAPADAAARAGLGADYMTAARRDTAHEAPLFRRAGRWLESAKADLAGVALDDATKKIAEIEKKAPPLPPEILFAAYGRNDAWADVGANVRQLLAQGNGQRLSLKTGAADLGYADPAPTLSKALVVVYRWRGQVCLSISGDGDNTTIPAQADAPPPAPAEAMTILHARYGAAGDWTDATAKVQELVKDGTLTVKPDDFGAPGKRKALVVVSLKGGRVRLNVAADGQTAVITGDASRFAETGSELAPQKVMAGPPIVFADFEGPDYGAWTTTGTAFGKGPSHGPGRGQQPVAGFAGRGLVNSYNGDEAQGTLTSPEFKIERNYVSFLVGGGRRPGAACINLIVDGKVVRTATGKDNERLEWHSWDVRGLADKTARIEIVDRAVGPWGHINIDQIEFRSGPRGDPRLVDSSDPSAPPPK